MQAQRGELVLSIPAAGIVARPHLSSLVSLHVLGGHCEVRGPTAKCRMQIRKSCFVADLVECSVRKVDRMFTIGTELRSSKTCSCLPPSAYFSLLLLRDVSNLKCFCQERNRSPPSSTRAFWSVRKKACSSLTQVLLTLKIINSQHY